MCLSKSVAVILQTHQPIGVPYCKPDFQPITSPLFHTFSPFFFFFRPSFPYLLHFPHHSSLFQAFLALEWNVLGWDNPKRPPPISPEVNFLSFPSFPPFLGLFACDTCFFCFIHASMVLQGCL